MSESTYHTAIVERMERIRHTHDLRQAAFAKSIGIQKDTYRRMISGVSRPSVDVVVGVCERYNVSADWLIFGKGEKK